MYSYWEKIKSTKLLKRSKKVFHNFLMWITGGFDCANCGKNE